MIDTGLSTRPRTRRVIDYWNTTLHRKQGALKASPARRMQGAIRTKRSNSNTPILPTLTLHHSAH
jgi:hypothetical protein